MKRILFSFFLFTSLFSFSQDLKCSDFKTGVFIAYADNVDATYKITRTENYQVEKIFRAPKELMKSLPKKLFVILKWENDCDYRIRYDDSKKMSNPLQFINDNNGVLVQKTKISGNCYYYNSIFKADNKEYILPGRICKESN